MQHTTFIIVTIALALVFFFAMLTAMEVGRRLGVRRFARSGEAARVGVGAVDGAIFAVFSLLLGFTFSGAADRYDHRRQLVIEETTMMADGWKRIDLLGAELQPAVRERFRHYVDAVLEARTEAPGSKEGIERTALVEAAQHDLWDTAIAACLSAGGEPARVLLIPALTGMFHAVESERLAQRIHPPTLIYVMLAIAAVIACLFAGYAMAKGATRSWLHMVGATATISIIAYMVFELESPRYGLSRVDSMDQAIAELRATMD